MAIVREDVTMKEDNDEARIKQSKLSYSALDIEMKDLDNQVINSC